MRAYVHAGARVWKGGRIFRFSMTVVNYTVAIKPPNKIYTTFKERRRQPESSETPPWRARGSPVEVRPPVDTAERDVRRKCRFRARGGEERDRCTRHCSHYFFSRVGNSFVEIVIAAHGTRRSHGFEFKFILSIERERRRIILYRFS